ncbi:MAG: element excision factor XisH family protein [Bacteroidota bacterium]
MAAKDKIHDAVVEALEKDNWFTKSPLYIAVPGSGVEIDLAAEKMILAERDKERIAVEIKTFGIDSIMQAFSNALGKYRIYLRALSKSSTHKDRKLFIATSMQGYYRLMDIEFIRETILEENIALIVVDVSKKIIKEWIE